MRTYCVAQGFPGSSVVKNLPDDAAVARDKGSDFLIWKDPTCCRAANPVCHNCGACVLEPGSCNY